MSVICLRTFFLMLKKILFISLIFYSITSNAQLRDRILSAFKEKPTFYGNYGSNYSFISNQFNGVLNVKLGLDFSSTVKLGIAYNWNKKGMLKQNPIPTYDESTLYMRYVSFFFEYTYFKTYHWEASIPAQIGIGNIYYKNTDEGNSVKTEKKLFVLYEPITTIQYRFLKYFAAGGGIGYRLVLPSRVGGHDQFSSILFVVKSKIYFGEAWRDFKKSKRTQK